MNKEEIHETTLEEYSHAINKYVDIMDCEDAYKINDYVSNLEYDNRKYKEVIDKAIEYIKCAYEMALYTKSISLEEENIEELLDILKEVE